MTREEAAKMLRREIECLSHSKCEDCILEKACDPMRTPLDSEYIEAFEIAIKALEQEPCEDAISRQVVLEAIEDDKSERYSCFASNNDAECFKQIIRELPSVSPQQKMGRWILADEQNKEDVD